MFQHGLKMMKPKSDFTNLLKISIGKRMNSSLLEWITKLIRRLLLCLKTTEELWRLTAWIYSASVDRQHWILNWGGVFKISTRLDPFELGENVASYQDTWWRLRQKLRDAPRCDSLRFLEFQICYYCGSFRGFRHRSAICGRVRQRDQWAGVVDDQPHSERNEQPAHAGRVPSTRIRFFCQPISGETNGPGGISTVRDDQS